MKSLPYDRLEPLVRDHLCDEEDATRALIRRLRQARARGYLRRVELELVCRWKSPRALPLIASNSRHAIRVATGRALATRSEPRRLASLRELRGVSVPMASSVLMLLQPRRYGVIDIRVWELLYRLGYVTSRPSGRGFTERDWAQFLRVIRSVAKALDITPRDVERALFSAHQAFQDGALYGRGRS